MNEKEIIFEILSKVAPVEAGLLGKRIINRIIDKETLHITKGGHLIDLSESANYVSLIVSVVGILMQTQVFNALRKDKTKYSKIEFKGRLNQELIANKRTRDQLGEDKLHQIIDTITSIVISDESNDS